MTGPPASCQELCTSCWHTADEVGRKKARLLASLLCEGVKADKWWWWQIEAVFTGEGGQEDGFNCPQDEVNSKVGEGGKRHILFFFMSQCNKVNLDKKGKIGQPCPKKSEVL